MDAIRITELLGDGTGPELRESVHAEAERLPTRFSFLPVDWSSATRDAKSDVSIDLAEESMHDTRWALKYPIATKAVSPNALIRRRCNFGVIYRPAISQSRA